MKRLLILFVILGLLFAGTAQAKPSPNMPVGGGNGCVSPTNSTWFYPSGTYFPYSTGYYTAWTAWSNTRLTSYWSPYELYCTYNPGAGRVVWVAEW